VDLFRISEADQLDNDALQSAVFTTAGVVDLRTDTLDGTSLAATVIQTDTQKYYHFRTQGEATQQPGDRTVFVAKSVITPKVGGEFTMLDSSWRIMAVVSELDSWAISARLA
jgi:hypothetical protein